MKRMMLVMVLGAALLGGCGGSNYSGASQEDNNLTIITVDWRGMKCDLVHLDLRSDSGIFVRNGNPSLALLGCYEAAR